jgi:acetylornithine deacetylase/succinyl-diaminopimelate desuccinylase-like protein
VTVETELKNRLDEVMPGVIDDLTRLVAIPSCAFPGFPSEPVMTMAHATVELLQRSGLPNTRLIDVRDGYPVVYGEIAAPPGAPMVLLYAHYDVQPAPPEQGWTVDPWTPTERDGRLYGRGAADDKAGIAVHAATLQVLRAVYGDDIPVGIRVIIEGEEETNSHLEGFVAQNPDLFSADVFVIADGGNEEVGVPVLEVTTRGGVVLTVEVRTLEQPVHSGVFGGAAPDALMALIQILATLHDDAGDVAVPGLQRDTWEGAETSEALFRRAGGLLSSTPLVGSGSLSSRLWSGPSINVIGLDAAPTATAVNALAPAARAVVSLRTPPNADPEREKELLLEHLNRVAPWGVRLDILQVETWKGWSTSPDGPAISAARTAMEEVFGVPANVIGSGGSIPLLNVLAEISPAAEFVLWGLSDAESSNLHSADESVDLAELRRIAASQVLLLSRLAGAVRTPAS